MSEEGLVEEDIVEEGGSEEGYAFGKYYCPKGNHYTPFFIAASPNSPFVRCPVCGASIGKKRVPRQAIIVDSDLYNMAKKGVHIRDIVQAAKRKGYLPEQVEVEDIMEMINPGAKEETESTEIQENEEETLKEEDEGEEEEPRRRPQGLPRRTPVDKLFRRPKSPCEVLQEVLEEFNLKQEFVVAMVRRCQRAGSMHPVELLHYLTTMKSGVKTQGEAQFIAEEYAAALREEMEKARRLNIPYPNIGITEPGAMQTATMNPSFQRLLQIVPPGQETQQPIPAGRQGYTPGRPVQQPTPGTDIGSLLQGIATLVSSLVKQPQQDNSQLVITLMQYIQQQQDKTLQLLVQQQQQQVQSIAKELGQGLQALAKSFQESLQEIAKMVQNQGKSADPELLYKAAKAEAEKEYLEKLLKLKEEETKKLSQTLSELEKKVYEAIMTASKPAGEFQSDEARLVAHALQQATALGNKLVDILDRRQPIKIIVEALPTLMQAQGGKNVPEKYKETQTETTNVIEELEKLGLVEEEGEENA